MKISVVVPVYNEAEHIGPLVQSLSRHADAGTTVIVVDGGSSDATAAIAGEAGAIVLHAARKGRAAQMNLGAAAADSDVLYFVHADVQIHPDFEADIRQALSEGYDLGCYRYHFDSPNPLLKLNAYCTRFDRIWCRGGDQTLFVRRTVFDALGGYRDNYQIMEDYDFIRRARGAGFRFRILPKAITVSARKYATNSYLRVQVANAVVMAMWLLGASQQRMVNTYKYLLDYR